MPTLEDVKRQIDALPGFGSEKWFVRDYFFTRREIEYLPGILENGEAILAVASGIMNKKTWLAVCSDRRVIFLNRGMVYGLKQFQIPHDRIQAIDNETGMLMGTLTIWDGATYIHLRMVMKKTVWQFVKVTREAMERYRRGLRAQQAGETGPPVDVASQIERLAALREKGLLTLEEFESQKRKILGN